MRFGGNLPGLGPASHYGFEDWFEGLEFQIDWAKRLDWRCFVPTEFRQWDRDRQRHAAQRMKSRDLVIPGLGAYQFNMLHPDPETRRNHVRGICELVERAAEIGVASVEAVAGSRHAEISYTYAPGNKSPEAWNDFVQGAREVCAACRGTGVRFALEPFLATLLDSPAALRRALDAIDCPEEMGINFDLVNFASMERCYELSAVADEVIEAVGEAVVLAHLKDVRYDSRPTLHLWEVPPGEGLVDYRHWLQGMQSLGRDFPAYVEHLSDMTQMRAAWDHIRGAAVTVGAL